MRCQVYCNTFHFFRGFRADIVHTFLTKYEGKAVCTEAVHCVVWCLSIVLYLCVFCACINVFLSFYLLVPPQELRFKRFFWNGEPNKWDFITIFYQINVEKVELSCSFHANGIQL